jgi:hypothetical protein
VIDNGSANNYSAVSAMTGSSHSEKRFSPTAETLLLHDADFLRRLVDDPGKAGGPADASGEVVYCVGPRFAALESRPYSVSSSAISGFDGMNEPAKTIRREFLRKATLAGAAAAGSLAVEVPTPAAAAEPGPHRKIKVGLIGCGNVSNIYLPNLAGGRPMRRAISRRGFLQLATAGAALGVMPRAFAHAAETGMHKKTKPILGSWISVLWSDRRHFYWNAACAKFSRRQWEQSVKEVADIVAYQDEVGCRRMTPEQSARAYEKLRKAHDRVPHRALWADVEVFDWEGPANLPTSPLIPAPFDRIKKQLEAVSPYVDVVTIYQYQGLFSQPGSQAPSDHAGATKLYADYVSWLKLEYPELVN